MVAPVTGTTFSFTVKGAVSPVNWLVKAVSLVFAPKMCIRDSLYPVPDRQDQAVSLVFHALEEVNVRSLPTSREGSQVLGVLSAGQEVLCTGRIGEWMQAVSYTHLDVYKRQA